MVTAVVPLLLAGCVAAPTAGASHDATSSATGPGSVATGGTAVPSGTVPASPVPALANPSATVGTGGPMKPIPDYSAPTAMPASDGRPMLWPIATTVTLSTGDGQANTGVDLMPTTRYGFLDVSGRLVLPERYDGYGYCTDSAGRASLLIVFDTDRDAQVFDLTGKRLAAVPGDEAVCAGTRYVVFTKAGNFSEETDDDVHGVYDLTTGKVVLRVAKGVEVSPVNDEVVNVSQKRGEYFVDLRTGRKTPHPGWVLYGAELEADAPGLPASTTKDGDKAGFVGLNGTWVEPPAFADATAFVDGYAQVPVDADHSTFVDTSLKRVGGTWTAINTVDQAAAGTFQSRTLGYEVESDRGSGLLDTRLQDIVPVNGGGIVCLGDASGACAVGLAGDEERLVVVPSPAAVTMPAGFLSALSPTFLSDAATDDADTVTIYSVASAKQFSVPDGARCSGAGTAFVTCEPNSGVPVVYDADGQTSFASVAAVADPAPTGAVAYYQVTTGRYEGIVDAHGAWCYRQSRYQGMDD